jgi:hypothetical protein
VAAHRAGLVDHQGDVVDLVLLEDVGGHVLLLDPVCFVLVLVSCSCVVPTI